MSSNEQRARFREFFFAHDEDPAEIERMERDDMECIVAWSAWQAAEARALERAAAVCDGPWPANDGPEDPAHVCSMTVAKLGAKIRALGSHE